MLLTVDFPESIQQLWISPGGTRLAVANSEAPGEILVIELPSGKHLARYRGLAAPPKADFRSESELVVAHGLDCWACDLATNSHRSIGPVEKGAANTWLHCCRTTPDDAAVALGGSNTGGVLLLDLAGGSEPRLLSKVSDGLIERINYSPDGRLVAEVVHTDEGDRWWRLIRVLDAESGETIRQLKLPEIQGYVYAPAFHPNNRTLAVGWLAKVLLFDLYPPKSPLNPELLFGSDWTGEPMGWARPIACYPLESERDERGVEVSVLCFSADGSALKVLCTDGEAILMSTDDGRVVRRTLPPTDREHRFGADISRRGQVAVSVGGKTVLTWEAPWWEEA